MTRFEKLHTPRLVGVAEKIAMLALDAEERTGKPVLFLDRDGIAKKIDEPPRLVYSALRLAYTQEFVDLYGYGFVAPGSGRDGARFGYAMQHNRSIDASEIVNDQLDYTNEWALDHLRGLHAHWERLAIAHGRNTTIGKAHQRCANAVQVSVDAIEQIIDGLD